jgi:hypothetical protein
MAEYTYLCLSIFFFPARNRTHAQNLIHFNFGARLYPLTPAHTLRKLSDLCAIDPVDRSRR